MKRLTFFWMFFTVLALTACGSVESNSAAPNAATPTPTVTPQKNTSDQLLLLGLTATVEFRGTATQNARLAGTAAATQTQIAATMTQKWEALTLTPAKQAMNQVDLDQAKTKNDVEADKAKKEAEAKAAAAKAEAEAKIAAAQASREEIFNRTISQVLQVIVDALPFVFIAIIFLTFCALGAFFVLWLTHYSRDREQKRKDASAHRRLSKNVGGQAAFFNGDSWQVIENVPPALAAPLPTAKPIQLSEVENGKRRDKWDTALWRFCQFAERIVNTNTQRYGSFTVNDMVNVYQIVERSDWDTITKMLMNAGVLVKDSTGTRYGTDEAGVTWLSGKMRSALLASPKRIVVEYPLDAYGNILPPPSIHPPTLPIAIEAPSQSQSEVEINEEKI